MNARNRAKTEHDPLEEKQTGERSRREKEANGRKKQTRQGTTKDLSSCVVIVRRVWM